MDNDKIDQHSDEIEVESEELEEVALVGIVAVAQHRLATEEVAVVAQLGGDVLQAGVELVFLCRLGGMKILVCHRRDSS